MKTANYNIQSKSTNYFICRLFNIQYIIPGHIQHNVGYNGISDYTFRDFDIRFDFSPSREEG
jgi:hypothetical protein